jgi:hypothetical protein
MTIRVWRPQHAHEALDLSRCCAGVPTRTSRALREYQCQRRPAVYRCLGGEEFGFCKTHDPARGRVL